jgi:hypothetical protein
VETPLLLREEGNFAEILAGPNAPTDDEAMVRTLLGDYGYPEAIPIVRAVPRRSEVP